MTGAIRAAGDLLGSGEPVQLGHLDVEDHQVRTQFGARSTACSPSPASATTS